MADTTPQALTAEEEAELWAQEEDAFWRRASVTLHHRTLRKIRATLDASRAEADRLRQERDEARSHLDQAVEHAAIGWDRAAAAGTARDVAERDAAQARALAAKLAEGLAPFAWVGQWLFARNLPDDEPVVTITGIGKPVALTRGMFKAAHALNAKALALGIGSAPAPEGEKGEG